MPGSRAKVGFVGTGTMGGPMARNLAGAGFAVAAWNRSREKSDALGSGIRSVAAAAEVAQMPMSSCAC
jgi:3-hydroxyisobutyrate dehydrogenase-like beta-hydroxyacid dehydrogenase